MIIFYLKVGQFLQYLNSQWIFHSGSSIRNSFNTFAYFNINSIYFWFVPTVSTKQKSMICFRFFLAIRQVFFSSFILHRYCFSIYNAHHHPRWICHSIYRISMGVMPELLLLLNSFGYQTFCYVNNNNNTMGKKQEVSE